MTWFHRLFAPPVRSSAVKTAAYRPSLEALERRDCPAVDTPTGLLLTPQATTVLKVEWNDTSNETGYRVLRWDGTNTLTVATLPANSTTFTVSGLPAGQKAWINIEAYDDTSFARTGWSSADMPPDPVTQPGSFQVTGISQTQLKLTWTDSTGETGYRVFRWNGAAAVLVNTLAADTTSYTAGGLTAGQSMYYYVEAFNDSNTITTAWVLGTALVAPITKPGSLLLHPKSSNTIQLSWADSVGETGYRVFRWDGVQQVLIATLAANATSYDAKGLSAGKMYWFLVQAFNPSNSARTDWKSATTTVGATLQPPGSPKVVKVSNTSAEVRWTASSKADGYYVFLWTGASWKTVGTLKSTVTKLFVKNLATHKTHFFMVQAFTAGNVQTANSATVFINL